MHTKTLLTTCIACAFAWASTANAAPVYDSQVVDDPTFNWASGPDNTYGTADDLLNQWGQVGLTNGGTAAVTADYPRNGNGSLKLTSGGGTNAKAGVAYYPVDPGGFGPFGQITAASFDWLQSAASADADFAPVMRMYLFDPVTNVHRNTIIWTSGNNPVSTARDTWFNADVFAGKVFQVRNAAQGGELIWQVMPFTEAQQNAAFKDQIVRAVEVGFGSGGWSPEFVGAVDNVQLKGSRSSVDTNFEMGIFFVTIEAGEHGSAAPGNGVHSTALHESLAIELTPAEGYEIDKVSGCEGTLKGTTFTTGAISGACTVSATFKPIVVTPPNPDPGPKPELPVEPSQPQAVPSMSEWGVMALSLLTFGLVARRSNSRRRDER